LHKVGIYKSFFVLSPFDFISLPLYVFIKTRLIIYFINLLVQKKLVKKLFRKISSFFYYYHCCYYFILILLETCLMGPRDDTLTDNIFIDANTGICCVLLMIILSDCNETYNVLLLYFTCIENKDLLCIEWETSYSID
jgi:hypothetical protein